MKKKTKRLLEQLGHNDVRKALKRAVMMRCALRVICAWSIQGAYDGVPVAPERIIFACGKGLWVKK
jgi:hypothetical protein